MSDRTILHIPVKARSYRYGILRFREAPTTEKLQVTYEIGVEDYMRGLSEVPESWSMASIESAVILAQAQIPFRCEKHRGKFRSNPDKT